MFWGSATVASLASAAPATSSSQCVSFSPTLLYRDVMLFLLWLVPERLPRPAADGFQPLRAVAGEGGPDDAVAHQPVSHRACLAVRRHIDVEGQSRDALDCF